MFCSRRRVVIGGFSGEIFVLGKKMGVAVKQR
jgi:hypothetical protein